MNLPAAARCGLAGAVVAVALEVGPWLRFAGIESLFLGGDELPARAASDGALSLVPLPALSLRFVAPLPPVLVNWTISPLQMLTVKLAPQSLAALEVPTRLNGDQHSSCSAAADVPSRYRSRSR